MRERPPLPSTDAPWPAATAAPAASDRIVQLALLIVAGVAILPAQKNAGFPDAWSWQGIVNPLILIAASAQVLREEWRARPAAGAR